MRQEDIARHLRGLYLDKDNSWVCGVCAGLADRLGHDVTIVRLIATFMLVFWTLPTAIIYGLAAALLKDRPLRPSNPRSERDFWRMRDRDRRSY
ncbi:MAG: PspC domain-containing protein [Pseudomonadota bacterium]